MGKITVRVVPASPEEISNRPPSCSARSRMPMMPTPKRTNPIVRRRGASVMPCPRSCKTSRTSRGIAFEQDEAKRAAGMLMDVGQPFLDDAEQGGFHLAAEPAEIGRNPDLNLDPGSLVETLSVRLQRLCQPDFVQQGRMQEVGEVRISAEQAAARSMDSESTCLRRSGSSSESRRRLRLMLKAARSCAVLSCSSRAILRLS